MDEDEQPISGHTRQAAEGEKVEIFLTRDMLDALVDGRSTDWINPEAPVSAERSDRDDAQSRARVMVAATERRR